MRSKAEQWAATKGQIIGQYEKDRPRFMSGIKVDDIGRLELSLEKALAPCYALELATWIFDTFDPT